MTPRPKAARDIGSLQSDAGRTHAPPQRRPAVAIRPGDIQAQSGVQPTRKVAVRAARPQVLRRHREDR